MVKFQSTHLHEVWRWVYMKIIRLRMFQSTHLHEVWPIEYIFSRWQLSFNPHTYMRCDDIIESIRINLKVSIHTPTWGVTLHLLHTSVMSHVSIHTPTWGVTSTRGQYRGNWKFQSTHLHEVWLNFYILRACFSKFQSTHLHEVWHCCIIGILRKTGFNPHTYMRCDRDIKRVWIQ